MAKPYKWALRVPEILEAAQNSRKCYWSRGMIQEKFCVRRTAATTIMKTVGGLHSHGLNLTVHTTHLKKFLIAASKAMDAGGGKASRAAKLSAFMKARQANASPPPKLRKVFTMREPDSVTVTELPSSIRLSIGEINIRFDSIREGVDLVEKLVRMIKFDFLGFACHGDPLEHESFFGEEESEERKELAEMFRKLEEIERKAGISSPIRQA